MESTTPSRNPIPISSLDFQHHQNSTTNGGSEREILDSSGHPKGENLVLYLLSEENNDNDVDMDNGVIQFDLNSSPDLDLFSIIPELPLNTKIFGVNQLNISPITDLLQDLSLNRLILVVDNIKQGLNLVLLNKILDKDANQSTFANSIERLKDLTIIFDGVDDFQSINDSTLLQSHMKNLTLIQKTDTPVPLSLDLPNLERLKLQIPGIDDFAYINCPNLKSLDLSHSGVRLNTNGTASNTTPASTSSTHIHLVPNLILSSSLTDLEYLNLSHMGLVEVPDQLSSMVNLKTLLLNDNNLEVIKNLQLLESLQKIDLSHNKLSRETLKKDFSLKSGSNLTTLLLSGNEIPFLEFNDNLYLSNLKMLDISHCQVSKICSTILQKLPSLEILQASNNKFEDLDGFRDGNRHGIYYRQNNLKELNLDYNNIKLLNYTFDLDGLRTLSLQGNQISKIENMNCFRNLKKLNLLDNKINKIENLDQCPQLLELTLTIIPPRDDEISKIENLEHLPNLTNLILDIKNCHRIDNLSQLSKLRDLKLLTGKLNSIDDSFQYLIRDNSLDRLEIIEFDKGSIGDEPVYKSSSLHFLKSNFNWLPLEKKISLWRELRNQIEAHRN